MVMKEEDYRSYTSHHQQNRTMSLKMEIYPSLMSHLCPLGSHTYIHLAHIFTLYKHLGNCMLNQIRQ